MKRCPTCHQTFEEEWLSFCTHDGTTLIDDVLGGSEPPPTIMAPASDAVNLTPPEAQSAFPEWHPAQPGVPEWQPPPPPLHVQPQSKSLATASMILGIISITIGWLCFGPIPGIASIILGAVALSQIKKMPDRVTGKQMAWAGIITSSVSILLYALVIVFYVFVIAVGNL